MKTNPFDEEARRMARHFHIYDDRLINILAYAYGQGFVDGMCELTKLDKATRIEDLEVKDATS